MKINKITINGKTFHVDADNVMITGSGKLIVDGTYIGEFPVGDLMISTGEGIEIPTVLDLYAKEAMGAMIIKGNFCFSSDQYIKEGALKSLKVARAMIEAKNYFNQTDESNGK